MKKKRILYFDILNILACFGVVCLHQNGIVHWYDIHTAPFKQSLIFEVGFFWAVPIFFMLSGATLFDYRSRYSTKEFLLRRAKRVLIPFLFFSVLMLIWHCSNGTFTIEDYSFSNLLTIILFNQHESIYWFFSANARHLPVHASFIFTKRSKTNFMVYVFLLDF